MLCSGGHIHLQCEKSMDQLIAILSHTDVISKPEVLFYYGAFAVLITVFLNWALSTILIVLKPFTCAAILVAFVRPDLVQTLLQDENLRVVADKMKTVFSAFLNLLLKLGEQFRTKLN